MNKLTPGKAINLRCKDCQPESKTEFFCVGCVLKNDALSNLKKIKAYCKWCCNNYNPNDYCSSQECSLYIYKNGRNPARKGIGNKSPIFKKNVS